MVTPMAPPSLDIGCCKNELCPIFTPLEREIPLAPMAPPSLDIGCRIFTPLERGIPLASMPPPSLDIGCPIITPLELAPMAPPSLDIGSPIFAPLERDIPLGESASVNNVILTKEHINRLREMVASKEKLRRFLCSSSDDQTEVPKITGPSVKKIVDPIPENEKNKEGECRELKVLTYTRSIFLSLYSHSSVSSHDMGVNYRTKTNTFIKLSTFVLLLKDVLIGT